MKEQPISVVIPTFNRAGLVVRAVRSALAAIGPQDEILVVDDGSTDNTVVALEPYRDRVRLIAATHGGAGVTRNLGVREAKHDWIAFLDSDDEWDPDKLELQRQLLSARPDVCFTFSDFRVVDRHGLHHPRYLRRWMTDQRPWSEILGPGIRYSALSSVPKGRADFDVHVGDLYPSQLTSFCIATFTCAFRRSACRTLPQFAEDVPTFEDHHFFGQLTRTGLGALLDCETATQNGHPNPRLTDTDALQSCKARLLITERIWGSDMAFRRQYGRMYDDFVAAQTRRRQRLLTRRLALEGRISEARVEARTADAISWKLILLLALPARIARALVLFAGKWKK